MQFDMKPGIHVTPKVDYGKFDWDRPQGHRRSVYRFVFRTLPDPLVECLDGADALDADAEANRIRHGPAGAGAPQQRVHPGSREGDGRATGEALAPSAASRSTSRCRLAWGRAPTADEAKLFAAYADKHGLANLCRVLFNTNEFLFAD